QLSGLFLSIYILTCSGVSASMMLLTLYGGYLCPMRGYPYMNKQKELQVEAENQEVEALSP
uniref:Uncharacterized protein n=1 Tax=Oncorhynchus kisutch TaxID=8019 RepID=A0A8C7GG01_ONCKI